MNAVALNCSERERKNMLCMFAYVPMAWQLALVEKIQEILRILGKIE